MKPIPEEARSEGDHGRSAGRTDREGRGTGVRSAIPSVMILTHVYKCKFWKSRLNLVNENCMSSVKF